MENEAIKDYTGKEKKSTISRRDVLAGLAALPVVGAVGYGLLRKQQYYKELNANLLEGIQVPPLPVPGVVEGKTIRLGIIGCGGRGRYLMRALGFMHPSEMDEMINKSKSEKGWDERISNFRSQANLNVEITAICDIFDVNAKKAVETGANLYREGAKGKMAAAPERFLDYKALIASSQVDAVVIATPDHWHVPIALEAARNGKNIYCEKPLSWSIAETYAIRDAVKSNHIVFQLGHQGRQTESYHVARSLIKQDVLGKISLIEVCTNRNDPNGAWVYDIPKEANAGNIDWKQFIGQAPWHEFSLERFFRWRCWWDYSTGLSGDLFTHEYDAMNQIFDLGIPASAMASGGIYFFKDGRTVPDVLNMSFEFPEMDLTLLYSATLASERKRGKMIMGHDANLELSDTLIVNSDPASTKYRQKIEQGIIDPGKPIFTYVPGQNTIDAVTSPTEKYFAGRGLLFTYRDGKPVDTTHLHLTDWLNCIRSGSSSLPACNIDRAFEEAMTAHMGTVSFKEGRRTYWDKEKEVIV